MTGVTNVSPLLPCFIRWLILSLGWDETSSPDSFQSSGQLKRRSKTKNMEIVEARQEEFATVVYPIDRTLQALS